MSRRGWLTGLMLVLVLPPVFAQDGEAVLRFAEDLYQERDFYRAITEYKRFLALVLPPGSPRADWVRFRIAEAYLEGGQFEAARFAFEDLAASTADPRARDWASLALARAFYLEGRYAQALGAIGVLPAGREPTVDTQAAYLAGCSHLRLGDLVWARRVLAGIGAGEARAGRLLDRLAEAERLPHKSAAAAGLLSIVPGLGHLYLGESATGLVALLSNGLLGAAAADAFWHRSYGVGALLGALELLWYAGTIYGAVAGAQRYNRDAERNWQDDLARDPGLDIPFPDPAVIRGILLSGSF